jgi:hypothetical protein
MLNEVLAYVDLQGLHDSVILAGKPLFCVSKSDSDVVTIVMNFKAACEAVRHLTFPENRSGIVLLKILVGPYLCPHPRRSIVRDEMNILLQSINNSHSISSGK